MQQFTEQRVDNVVVVAVVGAVDMLTAPQLQVIIVAAVERQPAGLVVDMTEVDFPGSAGMQVLMATRKQLGEETRFAVVADGPATSRPLKITGVTDYVELFPSLDAAQNSFKE